MQTDFIFKIEKPGYTGLLLFMDNYLKFFS